MEFSKISIINIAITIEKTYQKYLQQGYSHEKAIGYMAWELVEDYYHGFTEGFDYWINHKKFNVQNENDNE